MVLQAAVAVADRRRVGNGGSGAEPTAELVVAVADSGLKNPR